MNVPSAVAITVEISAISSEFFSAIAEVRDGERVRPVVEREALPGEVEAALVVVEREQDDDEDRDEQVEQRERRPEPERRVRQRSRVRSGRSSDRRLGEVLRAQSRARRAKIAIRMNAIRMNDSAAAAG